MRFEELSYASPEDRFLRKHLIRAVENLSGRSRLLPIYEQWKALAASEPDWMMTRLMGLLGMRLHLADGSWPPALPDAEPLVMIANHPFGIGDGIALLSLAEALRRPYRVFVASYLMKIPEIRPIALPIHFEGTREANRRNLETRRAARDFLTGGHTLVVFPAGAVATAPLPFGRARELPWKNFTARVVQGAQASVLPVYFDGQNSPLFHAASWLGETCRLSLLVSEFIRGCRNATIRATPGRVVPFADLAHAGDGTRLTGELRALVLALSPEAQEA